MARKPLEILQALSALKKKRPSMTAEQYTHELHTLRLEINAHLQNPRMSETEEAMLNALLKLKKG